MLNLFFPEKATVIVGLEIGTAKVAAVVGEVTDAGGVNVLGIGQCPSRGVRKGEVVNADAAAEDVRNAIVEAEKSADVEIASVYLSVTGSHLTSLNTHGVFEAAADDHEISPPDVNEVLANAKVRISRIALDAAEKLEGHHHAAGYASVIVRGGEGPGAWKWHPAGEAAATIDPGKQPMELVEIEPR